MISQGVSARIAKKVRRPRGTPAERRAVEPIFGWMKRRRRAVREQRTWPNVSKAIVDVAMGVRYCAGSPIVGPSRTDPDPPGTLVARVKYLYQLEVVGAALSPEAEDSSLCG